tara:strand:- start:448 stop:1023 length:576 start_codon:yes stop_codon:yes gene_type:complete
VRVGLGQEALLLETEAALGNATLSAVHAYWCRIKGENEVALRRDLDPTEIGPKLLPYSILVDVNTELRTVHHRVVGTHFSEFFGRDITGMELSSVIDGDYREFILGLYMLACERKVAVAAHSRFRWDQGRLLKASRLMMPLSRAGGRADMCYTCQVIEAGEGLSQPQVHTATRDGWEDVSGRFSHFSIDVV